MENFVLKDRLRHRAYNFPETLLSFQQSGKAPDPGRNTLLMDGVPVPYQTEKAAEGYILRLIADLPCRGEHAFTWKRGKSPFADLGCDNGVLSVRDVPGGLFEAETKNGVFRYRMDAAFPLLSSEKEISGGSVETVFSKTLFFEGGRKYRFELRLRRGLDYIEIREAMNGFGSGEGKLVVDWTGFVPDARYTKDRGTEKADAYADEGGKFPFCVGAFEPRTSWWDQRYAAYIDGRSGFWSGILLHDLSGCDDGRYAVWGSAGDLAFSLYENRMEAPVRTGKRAFLHIFCGDRPPAALGSHYFRYYSILSLDKVKDYVLEWEDDKSEYPKYFRPGERTKWGGFYGSHIGKASPEDMMNILDRDATIFSRMEEIEPVSCRAYRSDWAQTFDMTAAQLSDEQFARVRAAMALVCYTFADENFYPVENMLAGHPNFLTDLLGTVAVFAALLGKRHPMHDRWLAYYEIAMARNFKYHLRPAVSAWSASGGRWTENVGAYMMCMLRCVIYDCQLIRALDGGEVPVLYAHLKPFFDFLIDIRLPENEEGRRLYAPHGSHACTGAYGGKYGHGFMLAFVQLADMLENYEPLYSEYFRHNYRRPDDLAGVLADAGIYGDSYRPFAHGGGGTPPRMVSRKFTGFGFVLRDRANTDGEMCVMLQQIDEGPNYRWGRAAQGGCGGIYYYADRKRYTDHAPEDVGDENRGDVQSCTNFGVLVGHEFRSVGRNDLTEPLMDFGFARYARVNAGKYSAPYYKYRSVMMVENRYIAVYDAVGDARQRGRFAWAQNGRDAFPLIRNLRPGVEGKDNDPGIPVDAASDYRSKYERSRVKVFDGQGDFFTIVTHLRNYHDERPLYSVDKKDYGAELVFPQSRDRVFDDSARIRAEEEDFSFDGYVGYMTEVAGEKRLAVFDGSYIRLSGFSLAISHDKNIRRGMSGAEADGEVSGRAFFAAAGEVTVTVPGNREGQVFIDGKKVPFERKGDAFRFRMPAGAHFYNVGREPDMAAVDVDRAVSASDGFTVKWQATAGAEGYEICVRPDGEERSVYKAVGRIPAAEGENAFFVGGLKKGKYFVRVRGTCGEKRGAYGAEYPVFVTSELPAPPAGLRVTAEGNGFRAAWGEVLGCDFYRLYRVSDTGNVLVYEGRRREARTGEGEFFVAGVNGNGEGKPSLRRSTEDVRAHWDNHPEKGFVRDTRSHEHGYPGFDYVHNREKPILEYPEGAKGEDDVS